MSFQLSQWRTVPVTAALAIGAWVLSWTWFLLYIYILTQDLVWIRNLAIAIVLLSIFILRANNWARMIALMANAMAILFLGFLAFVFFTTNLKDFFIVAANMVLFVLAIYFFYVPATAQFFKFHSRPAENKADKGDSREVDKR